MAAVTTGSTTVRGLATTSGQGVWIGADHPLLAGPGEESAEVYARRQLMLQSQRAPTINPADAVAAPSTTPSPSGLVSSRAVVPPPPPPPPNRQTLPPPWKAVKDVDSGEVYFWNPGGGGTMFMQ